MAIDRNKDQFIAHRLFHLFAVVLALILFLGVTTSSFSQSIQQTTSPPNCQGSTKVYVMSNGISVSWSVTGGGSIIGSASGTSVTVQWTSNGVVNAAFNQTVCGYTQDPPYLQCDDVPVYVCEPEPDGGQNCYWTTQQNCYTVTPPPVYSCWEQNENRTLSVSVTPTPLSYSVGGGGSYCSGSTGPSVTLSGSESGVTYNLYRNGSFVSSLSGTGGVLTWTNQPGNYSYTITASRGGCPAVSMSGSANVTVIATPSVYTVGGGGSYCSGSGGSASVTLSGSETGVTYSLYRNGALVTNTSGTGGALTWAGQSGTFTYTVTASRSGCPAVSMTGSAVITQNSLPTVYTTTGGGSYCAGDSGVTINLSGSQSGINYQLKNGSSNVGTAVAGTGSGLSWTNLTGVGTYTVVATNAGTGCSVAMSGNVPVSVFASPTVYVVGGGGSYCSGSGGSASITLSGSEAGVTYSLFRNGALVTNTAGTGSALSWGGQSGTFTYTVTASRGGCPPVAMSGQAIINQHPLPTQYTVLGGGARCVADPGVVITLSNSDTGFSYQLKKGGVNAGSPMAGTGGAMSWPGIIEAGTYTVEATNNSTLCKVLMTGNAGVVVWPEVTSAVLSGSTSIVIGETTNLSVNVTGGTSPFTLSLDNGIGSISNYVSGSAIAVTPLQNTTYLPVGNISDANGCYGPLTGSATVQVNEMYRVDWNLNSSNVTINPDNTLTKTDAAAWNAGAYSNNKLNPGDDGWVEFNFNGIGPHFTIGLTTEKRSLGVNSAEHAFFQNSAGTVFIYENGTNRGSFGLATMGDKFKIHRIGNDIKYYKNSTLLRTIASPSSEALIIDVSLNQGTVPSVLTSLSPIRATAQFSPPTPGSQNGQIQVSATGGFAPYSFSWSSGEATSAITGKPRGNYTVTITDAAGEYRTYNYSLGFGEEWNHITQVTINPDNSLTRQGAPAWNAGVSSANRLSPGQDGWMEFILNQVNGNAYMAGLSKTKISVSSNSVEHGFYVQPNGSLVIYESGTNRGQFGTIVQGDIVRVAREGEEIKYYHNGTLLRTIASPSSETMLVDISLNTGTVPPISTSFSPLRAQTTIKACTLGASDGAITLTPLGGATPYTYSWSSGETTSSITGKSRGQYNVTITDGENQTRVLSYNLGYKQNWAYLSGLNVNPDNSLTKTVSNGWNAGGIPTGRLAAGVDGWIEFVVTQSTPNIYAIGLSKFDPGFSYTNTDYEFYINSVGTVLIYESGAGSGQHGTISVGDIFRLAREGATIKYYHNNQLIRSVATDPMHELMLDMAAHTGGIPVVTSSFGALRATTQITAPTFGAQNGTISLSPVEGIAPYSYVWSTGETTSAISGKPKGKYSVTISDAVGTSVSQSFNLGYPVSWTSLTSATVNADNSLSRTGAVGWTAGGASANVMAPGMDGWIEFSAPTNTGNVYIAGLSQAKTVTTLASVEHGFYVQSTGAFFIYESGVNRGQFGAARAGDIFKISREGENVKYYYNGELMRTVASPSSETLIVDVSIHTGGVPVVNSSFWTPVSEGLVPDYLEFKILKALYDSTNGAGWTNKTGWPSPGNWPTSLTSAEFSNWFGVTVANGDITKIVLPNNSLAGILPYNIGELTQMTVFQLNNNQLTGTIPSSIGLMDKLEYLYLYTNSLSGEIPAEIGDMAAIKYVVLSSNQLSGQLPSTLGNLTTLQTLTLNNTKFTGEIPDLSGCTSLVDLQLNGNNFNPGPIPSWLGVMSQMRILSLGNTKRNGIIPSWIGNLTALRQLLIHYNQLTGSIPIEIANLPFLELFHGYNNQLSGSIPDQITNISTLKHLSLASNQLTGSIPADIGNLTNLITLGLQSNQLTGSIPSSIGNLTQLTSLTLSANQLAGPIPASIGNLNKLTTLQIQSNQLNGSIPASIGNLTNLQSFYFYSNPLSGELPSSLGNLTKLSQFYGGSNQLSGEIPQSFANLTQLTLFYINGNNFSGSFPSFVGNWTKLSAMDIRGNNFQGAFPEEIGNCTLLGYLRADNNRFTSLPQGLLSLPLVLPNFDNNELTVIPDFSNHVNPSALAARVINNRLDFTQLEPLIGTTYSQMVYNPQKNINDVTFIEVPAGNQLTIPARPVTQYSTITWEKQQPNGTWLNVNANNNNTTQHTFVRNSVTVTDGGIYRWKMTNSLVTSVTLTSDPITIQINDAENGIAYKTDRLYNGTITSMRWKTEKAFAVDEEDYKGMYLYEYDEKYQLKEAQWAVPNYTLNTFATGGNEYRVTGLTYDPNGNIQTLRRYDGNASRVHNFTYGYEDNTNKLQNVSGYVNAYTYNAIGQMIGEDKVEGDDQYVEYDVTGKVRKVFSDAAKTQLKVEFEYDDRGFRLAKINHETNKTTWYIRDASGNVISIYEKPNEEKQINWTNVAGVNIDGSIITKTSGTYAYDAGASSLNRLIAGRNGWIKTTVGAAGPANFASNRSFGLSEIDLDQNYSTIDFSILLEAGGFINVYEKGIFRGRFGGYQTGDELKVERVGSTVYYKKNDVTFYISTQPSPNDLIADLSFAHDGGALSGLAINFDNGDPVLKEIPIYGSGKLATYYPQENGTTAYELTDHLGNVRAILKSNVTQYQATMEDSGVADLTNPRVQEDAVFKNLFETEVDDYRMNHTPPGAVAEPTMAAYLHWIDGMAGQEAANKAIGPAINLKVNPGDTVNLSVWAKYEKKLSYGRGAPQGVLATALGGTFALTEGLETLPEAIQAFTDALPLISGATASDPDTQPYAYLNYLIFDDQFNSLDGGAMRVPTTAGFDPGFELLPHQEVKFDPVAITATGYMYIWVSNESENTKVWFDDLTITHHQRIVTQATDYGPWGDIVREQKTNLLDLYRYGYQGQFAEKDEETGWNHFELREYDPVVGRWMAPDPEKQYSSPYVSMGNNPINSIDQNGGFSIKNHMMITGRAAANFSLKSWELDLMLRGVQNADYLGFASDLHFDNRASFQEIVNTWTSLNNSIKTVSGFYALGKNLHTVQDFYAHSNFIELYVDWYEQVNFGELPTTAPTFDEALELPDFSLILKASLRTGEFDVGSFLINEKLMGENLGARSHQQMNKDSASGFLGELAAKTAERHSGQIVQDFKQKQEGN